MENGMSEGKEIVDFSKKAEEDAKKAYLKLVWSMNKEAMFKELIRVHSASAELLTQAQAEIAYLKSILTPEDAVARH